jgi:hypothetical protein
MSQAQHLKTHPGVGALTALAFVLIIGEVDRFGCGKQIASYVGLVPAEDSSGERRRLGHISKQGNSWLRFLLVEAAQVTVRKNPKWRNQFFPSGHATRKKARESSRGTEIGTSFVLDVAARMDVRGAGEFRFARGTARKSPWCAVNYRRNDCASRSSSRRGV